MKTWQFVKRKVQNWVQSVLLFGCMVLVLSLIHI